MDEDLRLSEIPCPDLGAGKGPPGKIQSICNGKCDANYNAMPCADETKAAGAGTMGSNGKNNAQNNGKQSENPGGTGRFGILVMPG